MLSGKRNADDDDLVACDVTMDSKLVQGHTHTCSGRHAEHGGHMCAAPVCRRWFWKKGTMV